MRISRSGKLRTLLDAWEPHSVDVFALNGGTASICLSRICRASRKVDSAFSIPTFRSRSEEHTSELQSLMRISYAVFCLKKQNNQIKYTSPHISILKKNYSNT